MGKCQRRIALRVASAYCSVSADAVLIIANIPPIYLVKERLDTFNQKQLGTVHSATSAAQNSWASGKHDGDFYQRQVDIPAYPGP